MEEWKEYRLGDIATIKGGKRLPKGVNLIKAPNNHPYIRVQDLGHEKTLELNSSYAYVDDETQKFISKYIVNTGDIIMYNPQIEMFARFKMKSSFHKTKRII